jgi:hypothetical protein
LVLT